MCREEDVAQQGARPVSNQQSVPLASSSRSADKRRATDVPSVDTVMMPRIAAATSRPAQGVHSTISGAAAHPTPVNSFLSAAACSCQRCTRRRPSAQTFRSAKCARGGEAYSGCGREPSLRDRLSSALSPPRPPPLRHARFAADPLGHDMIMRRNKSIYILYARIR